MSWGLGSNERSRRLRLGQCFRCGEEGHRACDKGMCRQWQEQEAHKARNNKNADSKNNDKESGDKKIPRQLLWSWRRRKYCLQHNLCFRCKEQGHRWYHFDLCPCKSDFGRGFNYKSPPLRTMTMSFLDLPREIRDMVYGYTCDWNDAFSKYRRQVRVHESLLIQHPDRYRGTYIPLPKPDQLSTPSVLLLNRQITSEAYQVLEKIPLVLTCTMDEHDQLRGTLWRSEVRHFFGKATIRRIPKIELLVERASKIKG